MSEGQRKLAAIMFTDMVGYTTLGQKNESLALTLAEEQRKIIRPLLSRHGGREVKTMGDAFLIEFTSALEATRCAYDIQRAAREFNIAVPDDQGIHLRIGVHLGDVVESGGDISGDAVNIASRIEPLADDGGVCLTLEVYNQVHNKVELRLESVGMKTLKNVGAPMEVFRMVMPWDEAGTGQGIHTSKTRVAVLPFESISPDATDAYFADGMTEELIDRLSQMRELKVIARTSVMSYRKKEKKAAEIGKELGVGTLVEGSVRKAGDRIRVTAQLIDANTEEHLWSSRYDRELSDVFAVQTDIAEQVVGALKIQLLPVEKEAIQQKQTKNVNAYTLYLKGRYLWNRRGFDDLKRAAEHFAESIKEDPDFALGYAGLADCYYLLFVNWTFEVESNHSKAQEAVSKALELDPNLAEAHATLAGLLLYDYKVREAEMEFVRAISLKPSYATAHQWYFQLLATEFRWSEALAEIERAVELDPLSPAINMNHSFYYFYRKDYERSLKIALKVLELNGPAVYHLSLVTCYGTLKRFEDAQREGDIAVKSLSDRYPKIQLGMDVYLAFLKDDRKKVEELLPEIEEYYEDTAFDAVGVAAIHFYLGNKDAGFGWLEKSYSRREQGLWFLPLDTRFDAQRSDPRYLNILDRIGLGSLKDATP